MYSHRSDCTYVITKHIKLIYQYIIYEYPYFKIGGTTHRSNKYAFNAIKYS